MLGNIKVIDINITLFWLQQYFIIKIIEYVRPKIYKFIDR